MTVASHMAYSIQVFVEAGKMVGAEIHPNGFIRT
jgi:hypothetical protein